MDNYTTLKKVLNRSAAIDWVIHDQNDEFWLDPLLLRDLETNKTDYIKRTQHSFLNYQHHPPIQDSVPKANRMLREGIWLHPSCRTLYAACLRHLLGRLDSKLLANVYSYRCDRPNEPNAYQFDNKILRWKQFASDFRRAADAPSTTHVLVTDLASYYDHIQIDRLVDLIKMMVRQVPEEGDDAVIQLLGNLLRAWSLDGYGIPQNYDASSFFGSIYLANVDAEIVKRRYSYWRYVDDIRICATSEKHALRALHDLQTALQKERLYLNSSKTRIIRRGSDEYSRLLDVEDDLLLSRVEEATRAASRSALDSAVPEVLSKVTYHAGAEGDDRRFRAFANRALEIGDFQSYSEVVAPHLRPLVMQRIDSHPDRGDYWVKMLRQVAQPEDLRSLFERVTREPSVFSWLRFNIWRLLISATMPPIDNMLSAATDAHEKSPSELERGLISIFVGRNSQEHELPVVFASYFSAQVGYWRQRCALIAVHGMNPETRSKYYSKALQIAPDHSELVAYLSTQATLAPPIRTRPVRALPEQPHEIDTEPATGFGRVGDKTVHYRLSRLSYEYE